MFCCCFKFLKRRPKVLIIKIPSPIEEFDNVFYKQELNNIYYNIIVSYIRKSYSLSPNQHSMDQLVQFQGDSLLQQMPSSLLHPPYEKLS